MIFSYEGGAGALADNAPFQNVSVQRHEVIEGEQSRFVLQLIDESAKVQCDKEKSEQMMFEMINATVQNEIQNPVNSIYC